jgi:hypothetical protein
MDFATVLLTTLLALQQGVPGEVPATQDASGGSANWILIGIMGLFIVLALIMAVSYLRRGPKTPAR